ncbi:DNA repair-scaffolding protein [Xenopus tropicalis]|uniref:DNA repair-scaffolding protein n=1 Tax=Xenopus tropicalis TaxID=8364 RepID=B2GUI6_XENTR|nr:DNA repair-scaffolding protein [Xenopus tropicalis]AAI66296.1 Unknown (protein for MGC:185827) [Xenopus tropicalis]|eukprot:NP_001136380.1 DNA repair-scaffolding protein [Xenopus tropicalis]
MDLSASMKQFNDDVPEITGWQYECDSEEEKRTFSDAAESAVEISDPESLSSKATESQLLKGAESSKVMAMEIAEYSSDDEFDESYVPILPSHFPASNDGDVVSPTAKPASEWLKTAQVLLQTPEKKIDKASKTPEDSAKKRKRFLRGGLAERLSRLQNRERSAISFWRHQCESDCKITIGAKSGVLVLKIIQVHEECAIQVAHCTQQINDNNKEALCTNDSNDTSHLIVLFTCQTAAQLQVRPHDIIHIHPPCVCLLVQDAYGMFSELHLQAAELSVDHIDVYSKRWEGKTCCLTGMKILQRTTKGRAPGLFSLIDSLWPPLVPIKVHGQSQDQQVQNNLPVPSFCYVLAVHAEEIEDDEAEETPDLYLPPAVYTLRDIHQIVGPSQRCSFCGTVIYIRPEISANPAPQQEMWIFVTDSTLQEGSSAAPRTLSVCISPSCLLDNRVHQALCNKSPCALLFKDAIRENGRVICVERTVLSVQKPLLSSASGVKQVSDPVQLDDLDCAAQANSLCAVQGIITGVNEKTAYSWPVCNECGSNKLQRSDEKREAYLCSQCCQYTSNPDIRMQLEVFLRCDSMPGCTVRIKLQQETISLLLRLSPSVDGCYEVSNVLGMKVGPLNCYVQSASSQLGRYVELKEISLWKAN